MASLLLMLMTSVSADSLLSSLGDPETVEQNERKGVIVMNRSEMQELKERALVGAEVSDYSTFHQSIISRKLSYISARLCLSNHLTYLSLH